MLAFAKLYRLNISFETLFALCPNDDDNIGVWGSKKPSYITCCSFPERQISVVGSIASQSSTTGDHPANLAIDGNTDGTRNTSSSRMRIGEFSMTRENGNQWWMANLEKAIYVSHIRLWSNWYKSNNYGMFLQISNHISR